MSRYLGVDIGGTSMKAVVCDDTGRVLDHLTRATGDDGGNQWLRDLPAWIADMAAGGVDGIGVAAPGLAAEDGQRIASMPGRLSGLEGLDWREFLAANAPVRVLNDAHAALMAEAWCGAAKGCHNVMMLTLGTGVGGAAMVDGRILRGRLGRAGHLGHISMNPHGSPDIVNTPGSLESAIGECTLAARSDGRFATTRELIAAMAGGDQAAGKIWDESIRALAATIAGLINVLDPELVVLGGGIARSGAALLTPLSKYLDRFEWRPGGMRVRLALAELGGYAGAIGAAASVHLRGDFR